MMVLRCGVVWVRLVLRVSMRGRRCGFIGLCKVGEVWGGIIVVVRGG